MSTIRETVTGGLDAAGFSSYKTHHVTDIVVAALELREAGIRDHIEKVADEQGLSPRLVESALNASGMWQPPADEPLYEGRHRGEPLSEGERDELAEIRVGAHDLIERINRVLGT